MTARRGVARLIGAICFAYLIVLQAAVGGLASARHVAMAGDDPFSVLCITAPDEAGPGGSDRDHASLCCVAGCVPAAMTVAAGPEAVAFAYDPRPTPRRALGEAEEPPSGAADLQLKRPRGPPAAA